MNTSELQKRHLLALKEKYKIAHYSTTESDDFLYLILRKANLGIHINSLEFQWLAKNKLSATVEAILSQQYQAEDQKRLENELLQLRTKYQIPDELAIPINSPVYSILWKLETGIIPTDSELNWLKANGLDRQISLIQDILAFSKLKVTYQATKQLNQVSNEPLYSILNKLDAGNELVNVEIEWLAEFGFKETLEIYEKQVNERKSELEFLTLKSRYQVDSHPDTSTASPLYAILKKLDEHKELTCIECVWLKNHNIKRLAAIDRQIKNKNLFEKLKKIYKATQYQNSDSADPLFLILKKLLAYEKKLHTISEKTSALLNTVDLQLSEKDIQWLSQHGLDETLNIAKQVHFGILKRKYRIIGQINIEPFYEIMLKLEREERLDALQVIQLIEEGHLSPSGKIAIAHYRLEALFYEKEYQRTKNLWNLPSASSNWRKAEEPRKALDVTKNIDFNTVKELKLKSALLVTRGAAFRDIDQLDEAQKCAEQAIKCQPNSHQPCTLMGAICYTRGDYADGDYWFDKAALLGAKDSDDEIKRIIRMTQNKEKRREAVAHLLKKDPQRYQWAKSYLK